MELGGKRAGRKKKWEWGKGSPVLEDSGLETYSSCLVPRLGGWFRRRSEVRVMENEQTIESGYETIVQELEYPDFVVERVFVYGTLLALDEINIHTLPA